MSKNKLALLLFLGFIVTLIYACNDYPQQKRLPSSPKSEPYRTNKTAKDRIVTSVLPVASVKKDIPPYDGYKTDLFRPLFTQPPVPKKPKRSSKPRKIRPLPTPPAAVEPVKLVKPLVSRKLASFTYLGQVTEGEKRSIFLKEKGHIFVVNTGENFGEKHEFRLVQISEKEIRIAVENQEELIRIPLKKKEPLKLDSESLSLTQTAGPELSPSPHKEG